MPTVEPIKEHQLRINDPFQQRVLQFDIADSRYYLARTNNLEFDAIGKDIVLSGYRVTHSFDATSVTFTVSEGWVIIDSTLIYLKEPYELNFPSLTSFDEDGLIIVYLDYMWLEVYGDNPLVIQASHVLGDFASSPGSPPNGYYEVHTIAPESWNPNRDRVILEAFTFSKDGGGLIDSVEPVTRSEYFPIVIGESPPINYYHKGQHIDLDDEENHIHMWELFRTFVEGERLSGQVSSPASPPTNNPDFGAFGHYIEDHWDVLSYDTGSSSNPGFDVDGHILQYDFSLPATPDSDGVNRKQGFRFINAADLAEGSFVAGTGIDLENLQDVPDYNTTSAKTVEPSDGILFIDGPIPSPSSPSSPVPPSEPKWTTAQSLTQLGPWVPVADILATTSVDTFSFTLDLDDFFEYKIYINIFNNHPTSHIDQIELRISGHLWNWSLIDAGSAGNSDILGSGLSSFSGSGLPLINDTAGDELHRLWNVIGDISFFFGRRPGVSSFRTFANARTSYLQDTSTGANNSHVQMSSGTTDSFESGGGTTVSIVSLIGGSLNACMLGRVTVLGLRNYPIL